MHTTRVFLLSIIAWALLMACGGAINDSVEVSASEEEASSDRNEQQGSTDSAHTGTDAASQPPSVPEDGQQLAMYFVDVGQGSSAVFISPGGRVVVYDAGTRRGGGNTVRLLRSLGVEDIDLAIMSHPHADHLGGFIDIIEEFNVLRFMDPGVSHDSQIYLRLLDTLEEYQVPVFRGEAGRQIRVDEYTTIEIIAPWQPLFRGTRSDLNSNSIVAVVHFGEHRILLMGDAEEPTERRLVSEGELTPVDVLLVSHHGSAHSSISSFLDIVSPTFAVIQAGQDNQYGHPAPQTLQRLEQSGVEQILRNDIHGTVTIISDGQTLRVEKERTDSP